jgi:hypothetical protein
MDIVPGAAISIEIVAKPRRVAAQKTLARVCAKDPTVARQHRTQKVRRPSWQEWIRGGKHWHHQMKTKPPASLEPGSKYTVRATVDVMRDLQSVKEFVKVVAP